MTTNATTASSLAHSPTVRQLRRGLSAMGGMIRAFRLRWNDFVESSQMGPVNDTVISRHTGGRI